MKNKLCKIYSGTKKSFFELLSNSLEKNEKQFIITANAEIFSMSKRNDDINDMLMNDDVKVIADGIAVVKACHKIKCATVEKITGVETVKHLLLEANRLHKRLFVLGCTEEVLHIFKEKLSLEYPNIEIVNLIHGYVSNKEDVFLENIHNDCDLVLVALGVPNQELLIHKYFAKASKGIFVGVGGSIDVISGYKKRAPSFFVNNNLEWLYRICKEPKRISRFYEYNIKFLREIQKLK